LFGLRFPLLSSRAAPSISDFRRGWNTGDSGPVETKNYDGAAIPDTCQLHNPEVERICRKYRELRYRMLPYLYSALRECTVTGIPVMRALWLHFAGDAQAVARGDEYMWGPALLVAPVIENVASSGRVYLPHGVWHDSWTGERLEGGREISRPVDLETMPLYIRAGSIVPLGPVKQFVSEKSGQPYSVAIYPGTDASFLLYEDDGVSFNYRTGEWTGIQMNWRESGQVLIFGLAEGSRMLPSSRREFEVKLAAVDRRGQSTSMASRSKLGF